MTVTAYSVAPLEPTQYEAFYESSEPRAVAKINGSLYQLISYEIEKNAHGATDSAIIDLPLANNPDWTVELYRDQNENEPVFVEIWAGFPAEGVPPLSTAGLTLRFIGILDQYTLNIGENMGEFRCRSLAAPLVDTMITTLVQNMTSVDFVTYWATQQGLTPVIQLEPGAQPVSLAQVYASEFIVGVKNMRVWDVMLQTALFDNVDVWVDLDKLYYAAPSVINRPIADLKYGRDLLVASLTHSPQYNKNIRVQVKTYQPLVKTSTTSVYETGADGSTTSSSVTVSVPFFGTKGRVSTTTSASGTRTTTSASSGGGFSSGFQGPENENGPERYTFYKQNLSPQQCNDLARKLWLQISMHEYALTLHLPMTKAKLSVLSNVTSLIRFHGSPYLLSESSNTSTDKTTANDYWPRRMTEEFSEENGWTMEIEAVNHQLPQGAV